MAKQGINNSRILNRPILNSEQYSLAELLFVVDFAGEPYYPKEFNSILNLKNEDYGFLAKALIQSPEKFDKILLAIHFHQNENLSISNQKKIIEFLTIAYYHTGDIRYFNECLFFLDNRFSDYHALCLDKFHSSLENSTYHISPRSSRIEACEILNKYSKYKVVDSDKKYSIRKIGLFGHPKGFKFLGEKLIDLGYDCHNIHLPKFNSKSSMAYKRRFLTRFAFSNRILYYLFKIIDKYRFGSCIITEKSNSLILGDEVSKFNFDIALHRLYGIIRSNLYENSGLGILNDHVGFLPFFRGWSTIEYAILLGFPLASTVHFVDKGVDTGKIIKVFPFVFDNECNSLNDIVDKICKQNSSRILEVLETLSNSNIDFFVNDINKGHQFFRMHDSLNLYVEKICLEGNVFNYYEKKLP
jgi:hypothetical protein